MLNAVVGVGDILLPPFNVFERKPTVSMGFIIAHERLNGMVE